MESEQLSENIQRVCDGDLAAYAPVIRAYELRVRMVLAAMLIDKSTVEDLAQETFIVAYDKMTADGPPDNFGPWVKQIARNLALNERRSSLRTMALKDRYHSELLTRIEHEVTELETFYSNREAYRYLRECIDELERGAAEVVHGFYFEGLTSQALGQRFKRSAAWARKVLQRCRVSLGECLRQKGFSYG